MTNNLYLMGLKVTRGTASDMPEHFSHAVAITFAAAPDPQAALRKAVRELAFEGYVFQEVEEDRAVQIPVENWGLYVEGSWPELADQLPSREQITDIVANGQIFFGGFLGYGSENAKNASN